VTACAYYFLRGERGRQGGREGEGGRKREERIRT